MKRTLVALLLAVAALALLGPSAANAEEAPVSYRPAVEAGNVVQDCRASDNVVVFVGPGFEMPLDTYSLGACVSTLRNNELSTAAYNGNCKVLEVDFAAENESGRPYPYAFYGNPNYVAENRRDCIQLLRGFHTGQLVPGPPA